MNDKFRELCRLNERKYGIYLTINETDGKGVKNENITGIRALWADWDHGAPDEVPLQPSFTVRTSPNRMQAYWLLNDEMTNDEFKACMGHIVTAYGGDDKCKDRARVLRVPGFNHTKAEPWRVRFAGKPQDEVTTYSAKRLTKAFPPIEKAKPAAARKEASKKLSLVAFTFDGGVVKQALDFLPDEIADDYATSGVKVCAALKRGSGGSDEGRELWHEFASRSDKFTQRWADEKWNSYDVDDNGDDKITLARSSTWQRSTASNSLPANELRALTKCQSKMTKPHPSSVALSKRGPSRRCSVLQPHEPGARASAFWRVHAVSTRA